MDVIKINFDIFKVIFKNCIMSHKIFLIRLLKIINLI